MSDQTGGQIRNIWRFGRWLLIPVGFWILAMTIENRLVFQVTPYPKGDWKTALPVEDANFIAADGTKLHGWFVLPLRAKYAILFAHGNGGNITHRKDILKAAGALGAAILAFDYRGYGKSEGSPTEAGVYSDARAARAWLAQRMNIAETQIVLWGESLGTAVMIDLAAADGARGLILENPISSVPDVAAFHYRWLPVRWLMKNKFDAVSKIANYHGPLLIFHGEADTVVPLRFGQALFAAANEPKQMIVQPGRDHNDLRTPEMFVAVHDFLNQLRS